MEANNETDKSGETPAVGTSPENQTISTSGSPKIVNAHTFIRMYNTFTKPFPLMCDDGCVYVVKARQNGKPEVDRAIINDYIIARIGIMLGTPIPEIALVNAVSANDHNL